MTNEQAIEYLKIIDSRYPSSLESTFNDECERIALNMAMQSLKNERPQGEWKFDGWSSYCSECGYRPKIGGGNFCKECGAKMKQD